MTDELLRSLWNATLRSSAAFVARSNILSGPLLLIFVNVSNRFSEDWMASSAVPVCACSDPASPSMWLLVTPAALPVDFRTAAV